VEFDHADIYKDLDAVETSFKRLVNLVPRRGRVVAFDTGDSVNRSVAKAFCPVERYGSRTMDGFKIVGLEFESSRTHWYVLKAGEVWGELEMPLAGEYNAWNATAAAVMANHYGIPVPAIRKALETFKSVKRRLEVKAEVNGITIIDDFAHHPTAIAGTLTALRGRYPGRRLWAILEPRSNTLRRNVFQHELVKSLGLADEVIVAGVFKSDAIPVAERLDLMAVGAELQQNGKHARIISGVEGIVQTVAPELRSGDVVAILSNGGFDGIYEKLPARLKQLTANTATRTSPLEASAKA
jgi:UDP-N-acetylmuramate: L-alanyl-gamma-D-glutamyl-meso-diaminopimelate ligase